MHVSVSDRKIGITFLMYGFIYSVSIMLYLFMNATYPHIFTTYKHYKIISFVYWNEYIKYNIFLFAFLYAYAARHINNIKCANTNSACNTTCNIIYLHRCMHSYVIGVVVRLVESHRTSTIPLKNYMHNSCSLICR